MRTTSRIVSLLLVVIGAIFAAQGGGLIGGSRMTGDHNWLVIGAIMVVAGLVLGRWSATRRP